MLDPLLTRVLATPIQFAPSRIVEDWGHPRGQGKRIGNMVRGAMSDPPRGKKIYLDAFGSLPDISDPVVRIEVDSLVGHGILVYLKARSMGLNHETAMWTVLENDGEVPPGATAAYLASQGAI
jgi:hypothetical protein